MTTQTNTINVVKLTFNPFQENTYILHDNTKQCVIIDPGCYTNEEKRAFSDFIINNDLTPVKLLNTHCHIDHVFGNKFVAGNYNLDLEIHKNDLELLNAVQQVAHLYGIPNVDDSPKPTVFLEEGDKIEFGNSNLEILFVPGHAPGHIAFVSHKDKFVISGDVLFKESIGRTDLPGGDFDTLINSIKTKIFSLPDDYTMYSGHGPETTIGWEKSNNPFLQ